MSGVWKPLEQTGRKPKSLMSRNYVNDRYNEKYLKSMVKKE